MNRKFSPQSLAMGTALLLRSHIFVKGLGFFYRVVLVRLLGTEGMGLIEMASPMFSFLLVMAGCGVQTALSQAISGRGQGRQGEYFRTGLRLLLLTGSFVTLAALVLSPLLISRFASDPRISTTFVALLPAVLIISVASAWRGYAQGTRQVSVLGMSQNIEQIIRVAVGIWLATRLIHSAANLSTAVAATSVATVCGELAGFLYLVLRLRPGKLSLLPGAATTGRDFFRDARDLLAFGLPTTAGRLVTTALAMAQALLIPLCLREAGCTMQQATELYGRFAGVALSLLHLPGVFTAALAVSVLPAVAESVSASRRELLTHRVDIALSATVNFSLPGMLLLFVFAEPLCGGLFNNPAAAELLRLLVPAGIFFYMQVTLTSILQGLGEVRRLLLNTIISGALLLAGITFLTPRYGINGAIIAIDLGWLIGFLLNVLSCYRAERLSFNWLRTLLLPLAAAGGAWLSLSVLLPPAVQMGTAAQLLQAALLTAVYALLLLLLNRLYSLAKSRSCSSRR